MRKIVVTALLVTSSVGSGITADAAHAATPPVVYAHRGGAGYAPENTLAAFRKTTTLYGDRGVWLEMDTQATADSVLVVLHDDSVNRTTNCTGKLSALTLAQLAPCDAAANFAGGWPEFVPIPTLEQVLVEGRDNGWRLMVEIKNTVTEPNFDAAGTVVADRLIEMVDRVDFPSDRLLIQSFWPPALERIELKAPTIGTVLLTSATVPSTPVVNPVNAVGNATFAALRGYEVSSPAAASSDLSALSVTVAHTLGRQVVPWTIDDAATLTRIASYGVDGVITNRPDIAFATLS